MSKIPSKLSKYKADIGERQGWICRYCAIDIFGKGKSTLRYVIDPDIGGKESVNNLQLLCRKCANIDLSDYEITYVKLKDGLSHSVRRYGHKEWLMYFKERVKNIYDVDISTNDTDLRRNIGIAMDIVNNFILFAVLEYWWKHKTTYENIHGDMIGCSQDIFFKGKYI